MRRIRERRWIQDEIDEELDREAARLQQARRQRLNDQQRRFQVSRTQEDEIREQFLNIVTEKYTTTLSKSDVFESDHHLVRSSSFRSVGSNQSAGDDDSLGLVKSPTSKQNEHQQNEHQQNEQQPSDGDIEAPPQKERNNYQSDDEEDFMLVEDFQQTNEVVRVPLPGQQNDSEAAPRFVPNGCAICLSKFEESETMTWSSNPECSHVFHHPCVVHWYLTVGRRAQQRRQRTNPDIDEIELLDAICKFPMLCPCCRQTFFTNPNGDGDDDKKPADPQLAMIDTNTTDETRATEQEITGPEGIDTT